jgi:hypothetical protein
MYIVHSSSRLGHDAAGFCDPGRGIRGLEFRDPGHCADVRTFHREFFSGII